MWRSGCSYPHPPCLPPASHSLVASGNVFFPGGRVGGAAGWAGRGGMIALALSTWIRVENERGNERTAACWGLAGGLAGDGMVSRSLSLG